MRGDMHRHTEASADGGGEGAVDSFTARDSGSVTVNGTITVGDATDDGVLVNDTDAEGNALTAREFLGPKHGTLNLRDDGTFDYTPAIDTVLDAGTRTLSK